MEEFDPYDVAAPTTYAQNSSVSPTLSLLIGANEGSLEQAENDQLAFSPAAVAAKRASQERRELLELTKNAATAVATTGNAEALQVAIQEIQNLQIEKPASYHDDVQTIALATIERIMAETGKSADEIIAMAEFRQNDLAVRSAIEVAINSMEQRSGPVQFARDVLGVTGVKDWARISPLLNEFNELYGYGGDRALTAAGAATNFVEMLRNIEQEDRAKVLGTLANRLIPAIGEKDARRVFEAIYDVTELDPAQEAIFNSLDWLALTQLAKGALKGVLAASRGIRVARDVGKELDAAEDVTRQLIEGKSLLGVSNDDAVSAALNFQTLSKGLDGLSSPVQTSIRNRLKTMLDDVNSALYSGGANMEELLATKRRLEDIYNNKVNSSIVSSSITTDVAKGNVGLNVLYGDRTGRAFATQEDALSYYKNIKRGDLEVVPVTPDNSARLEELTNTIKNLMGDINNASKKSKVLPAQFAEAVSTQNKSAMDTIETVFNKLQNGEKVDKGLETTVAKIIRGEKTLDDAARKVQEVVPEDVRVKLRQLEDAVEESVLLSTAPPKPGYYLRQKLDMPVFLSDIGKIDEMELNATSWLFGKLSPRTGISSSVYEGALLSNLKRDKVGSAYVKFVEDAFDKLNKAETERVNEALIKTEKLRRDMSEPELAAMGIRTEKEVEAYYTFRTMREVFWHNKESSMHRQMVAQGYQNILISVGEEGLTGPAQLLKQGDLIGKRVFNAAENKFTTVTQDNINEFSNYVAYKYAKGQKLPDHQSEITTVLVDPNRTVVGDLMAVVGRQEGAYSRVYMEDYFIKFKGKSLIDDAYEDVTFTLRTAGSEKAAKEYVDAFNNLIRQADNGKVLTQDDVAKALGSYEEDALALAERFNNGDFRGGKLDYNFDRTDGNYFTNIIGTGSLDMEGGRVFWSGRGENAVKSISTGASDAVTLGPLASLQAELNNVARFTSLSEWRRNTIQRWYNTFEDLFSDADKAGKATAEQVFYRVANRAEFAAKSDPRVRQMLAHKDFIMAQLGLRTADEAKVQHAIRSLLPRVLPDTPVSAQFTESIKNADLPQYLKSINSRLMLGLWSPAQLLVQASGGFLATLVSPKHGMKSAFTAPAILRAVTSNRKEVHSFFNKAHKTDLSNDEFHRIAVALERTGYLSNIRASSIYTGHDDSVRVFGRKRKAFDQSQMMFFNTGEEYARATAFDIARREFVEANPKLIWDSDENLRKIMLRADDLTFNMTRTNEARWSQGWAGIPIQFLHHPIRVGASIFNAALGKGNHLKRREAMSLMLGSYLMYGINNNATYNPVEDWLGDKINGTLSEEQKLYITQGVLAGLIYSVTDVFGEGVSLAVGSRLSSIQWYEDMALVFYDLFQGEKFEFGNLFGPTGSTLEAILEVPKSLRRMATKDEITTGDFLRTMSEIGASLASSWRGIDKAYWAYHANGVTFNKKGEATAQLNTGEIIAQALGIGSTEAFESRYIFQINKEYNRMMDRYADQIMHYKQLSRKAFMANDSVAEEANNRAASAIFMVLPVADQRAIMSRIRERAPGDVVLHNTLSKWRNNLSSRRNQAMVNSPYGE